MFDIKIEEFMEHCKNSGYHIKLFQQDDNIHRLNISNQYLQRMELKIINGSKIRVLSHEKTRFAQEMLDIISQAGIETIPYHYDHVLTPCASIKGELKREERCRMEFEIIADSLENMNPHDEIKIHTSSKGLISIMKDSNKICSKYPGSMYERIYNTIKDKKLIIHFEWIRKTPPRRKPKRGEKVPVINKKLTIR